MKLARLACWRPWFARIAPAVGVVAALAFGWESLPPWHRPADRAWHLERDPAPLPLRAAAPAKDDAGASSPSGETIAEPSRGPQDSIAKADDVAMEATPSEASRYWLNARSGIRHNAECRYFDPTGAGRFCGPDEGRACGICGG